VKHLLLLTLISFSTIADEYTKEEHLVIGLCTTFILQNEHHEQNPDLRGNPFLASFWSKNMADYGVTLEGLFDYCLEMVRDHNQQITPEVTT